MNPLDKLALTWLYWISDGLTIDPVEDLEDD